MKQCLLKKRPLHILREQCRKIVTDQLKPSNEGGKCTPTSHDNGKLRMLKKCFPDFAKLVKKNERLHKANKLSDEAESIEFEMSTNYTGNKNDDRFDKENPQAADDSSRGNVDGKSKSAAEKNTDQNIHNEKIQDTHEQLNESLDLRENEAVHEHTDGVSDHSAHQNLNPHHQSESVLIVISTICLSSFGKPSFLYHDM